MRDMLYTLPDFVGNSTNLKVLIIANGYGCSKVYSLNTLPDSIGNLINLRVLNLENNSLTALPDTIGHLKSLKELNLSSNWIKTLPMSFGDLQNLQELNLSKNKFNTLPESISNLENLELLNLEGNELKELPESIIYLTKLKKLSLNSNNYLYSKKHCIQITYNKSITYFEPKEVPNKIYDFLESLKDIKLPKHLSIELFSLNRHVVLQKHIMQYDIKSCGIPIDISRVTKMESLDARGVSVKKIPPSLSKLIHLKTLDLRDNPELNELPDFLWEMPNLSTLYVENPLIKTIPTNRIVIEEVINNDKIITLLSVYLSTKKNPENPKRWSDQQLIEFFEIKNYKNYVRLKPLRKKKYFL